MGSISAQYFGGLGSNISPQTNYPDRGFSQFSTTPPGKYQDSSNQTTTASFHIFFQLTNLLLDAIQSEILTVILNKHAVCSFPSYHKTVTWRSCNVQYYEYYVGYRSGSSEIMAYTQQLNHIPFSYTNVLWVFVKMVTIVSSENV